MENLAKVAGAIILAVLAIIVVKYTILLAVNLLGFIAVSGLNVTEFLANHLWMSGWVGWLVIWGLIGTAASVALVIHLLPPLDAPPGRFPRRKIATLEASRLGAALILFAGLLWLAMGASP